jgi:hypothetical protein
MQEFGVRGEEVGFGGVSTRTGVDMVCSPDDNGQLRRYLSRVGTQTKVLESWLLIEGLLEWSVFRVGIALRVW